MRLEDSLDKTPIFQRDILDRLAEADEKIKDADRNVVKNVVANLLQLGSEEEETKPKRRKTGAELGVEAVNNANRQQDVGENWEDYSEVNLEQEIPLSVEERKVEEKMAARRKTDGQLNIGDLQNEMAVKKGLISC